MYNSNIPTHRDLPSNRKLIKSTIFAAVVAAVLLITTVLPAEYGIDPTGIGQAIGLKKMGEIKVQLAEEAAAEKTQALLQKDEQKLDEITMVPTERESTDRDRQDLSEKRGGTQEKEATKSPEKIAASWKDQVSVSLKPGQGVEFKLVMEKGAKAWFEWTANGSQLNFDAHGNGDGRSIQYDKGRGVPKDEGVLNAAFKGDHGWFWRNRTDQTVTLTLKTKGEYLKLKRTA
ncbi:MAG: hypothetical protein ABIJ59_15650 [Pseudomonadota bacterium]